MNALPKEEFDLQFRAKAPNLSDTSDSPHLAIQILGIVALGIVSIIAVSMAFDATWVAGVAVVAILFPLWMKSPAFAPRPRRSTPARVMEEVGPQAEAHKPSGNASFDAYRSELLARLEQENRDFQSFLERLRASRDKSEFDQFMEDRANRNRSIHEADPT